MSPTKFAECLPVKYYFSDPHFLCIRLEEGGKECLALLGWRRGRMPGFIRLKERRMPGFARLEERGNAWLC
jgi:hypothetical protein